MYSKLQGTEQMRGSTGFGVGSLNVPQNDTAEAGWRCDSMRPEACGAVAGVGERSGVRRSLERGGWGRAG